MMSSDISLRIFSGMLMGHCGVRARIADEPKSGRLQQKSWCLGLVPLFRASDLPVFQDSARSGIQ